MRRNEEGGCFNLSEECNGLGGVELSRVGESVHQNSASVYGSTRVGNRVFSFSFRVWMRNLV